MMVRVDQYTVGDETLLELRRHTVLASGVQVYNNKKKNKCNCHRGVVFGGGSWQSSENIAAV